MAQRDVLCYIFFGVVIDICSNRAFRDVCGLDFCTRSGSLLDNSRLKHIDELAKGLVYHLLSARRVLKLYPYIVSRPFWLLNDDMILFPSCCA